ncbi:MAG: DUF1178 domain-containing protein [Gammaproteobacteria bacterium]|nr:MAG: DUF1178 domain-containing protein [Gammaproteobacteria bacterium]
MVVYDLKCAAGHGFEGWFRSPDDFQTQCDDGLLSCPVCHSVEVLRKPSAARLNRGAQSKMVPASGHAASSAHRAQVAMVKAFQHFVDRNFENVGSKFANEARRMHYGEAEERNIRGQATHDEVRELHDEGIEAQPLPIPSPDTDKLN